MLFRSRLFDLSGESVSTVSNKLPEEALKQLKTLMQTEHNTIIDTVTTQDTDWFNEELTKLDKWAQDIKQSMEKNIKNMDGEIADLRKQARKSAVLKDRLALEKKIRELEAKRNKQRFELYTEQDKIDQQKEKLIVDTQEKLRQEVRNNTIFNIRWSVV